jgi:hypothetical protein
MNQYLIAFCYLFTIVHLFLAFFIICAVPSGSPLNIDLYHTAFLVPTLALLVGPPSSSLHEAHS